jgi:hypothetical protein
MKMSFLCATAYRSMRPTRTQFGCDKCPGGVSFSGNSPEIRLKI